MKKLFFSSAGFFFIPPLLIGAVVAVAVPLIVGLVIQKQLAPKPAPVSQQNVQVGTFASCGVPDCGSQKICDRDSKDPVGECKKVWYKCCDLCSNDLGGESGCDAGHYGDDGPVPTADPNVCNASGPCDQDFDNPNKTGATQTFAFFCENLSCTLDQGRCAKRCDNSNKDAVFGKEGIIDDPCALAADGLVNGKRCGCFDYQLDWANAGGSAVGWRIGTKSLSGADCQVVPPPGGPTATPTSTPVPPPPPTLTPTPTPTVTPTPTQPPSCGSPCTPGTTVCPEGCSVCAPGGDTGGNVCQAPSPTPTVTLVPTRTPTPTINPALCDCDGIDFSGNIAPGQTIGITTFAKVPNPDSNNAKVLNMVYHVQKNGAEIANSSEIAPASPQRTVDSSGIPIDRYSTSWNFAIPSSDTGSVSYRVWTKINCGYKTAQGPETTAVLGTETVKQPTFFDRILQFFAATFGTKKPAAKPPVSSTVLEPTITANPNFYLVPTGVTSLQLGTFYPASGIEKKCHELYFNLKYP